jgi:hypothetical protein
MCRVWHAILRARRNMWDIFVIAIAVFRIGTGARLVRLLWCFVPFGVANAELGDVARKSF